MGHRKVGSPNPTTPAYVDFPTNNLPTPTRCSAAPSASPATTSSQPSQRVPLVFPDIAPVPTATRTTRSGRRVHWPTHERFRSLATRWRGSDVVDTRNSHELSPRIISQTHPPHAIIIQLSHLTLPRVNVM